jgi:hypothetical protein
MQVLDVEEMESSSKINLKDVSWWMSIRDTCRPREWVISKLLKEGCISLAAGGRPSHVAHKHDWSKCEHPSTWETYSSKTCFLKIWNLEHKYGTTKAQFVKKTNGAQSSIERRPISPKDSDSWAWHLIKGPWKDSHEPRPIMSHIPT